MAYSQQDLIDWTVARMDEVMPAGQDVQAPIDFIERELDESARKLLRTARLELLYPVAAPGRYHYPPGDDPAGTQVEIRVIDRKDASALIVLPTDYLRFVRLKMTGWERPVDQLAAAGSVLHRNQQNKYLRGGNHRPAVVLVPFFDYSDEEQSYSDGSAFPEGNVNQALHCWSGGKGTIETFSYIPRLDAVQMPGELSDPLVWLTASRALTILRQPGPAGQALEQMNLALSMTESGLAGAATNEE